MQDHNILYLVGQMLLSTVKNKTNSVILKILEYKLLDTKDLLTPKYYRML